MVTSFWTHDTLSNVAAAILLLFISSAAIQRLTTLGRPMIWPVLGIIPTFILHMHEAYDWCTDALILAGGTFSYRGVWFGNYSGILTSDPSNVEYILKTHFSNFPKGKYYHDRFTDLLGNGIFNADGSTWRAQRRIAAAEMHSSRYSTYSAGIIHRLVSTKLLPLLSQLSSVNAPIDLQDILLRFTFDNICMAAFGVDTGCLSLDLEAIPFATAFEEATELTLRRFILPPFIWKPMKRLQIGYERMLTAAVKEVHDFAEKTVSERRKAIVTTPRSGSGSDSYLSSTTRFLGLEQSRAGSVHVQKGQYCTSGLDQAPEFQHDLLSRLLEADSVNFSDEYLKDMCISFILAGRDTSSVAMGWFFWLLHRNPRVEEKILEEVLRVARGRCMVGVFTAEDVKGMEYLGAALSESMRLYPSVPMDFKEAVEDDVLPDGTRVRKGDRVMYSIYSMGRMERIWGEDCREFRPERWMKDGVFVGERDQFKYVVFNGGPRMCVGKKFAYMQMKMVVASVLVRYRVVPLPEQEVVPKITTTLYMKNGLMVQFVPRVWLP